MKSYVIFVLAATVLSSIGTASEPCLLPSEKNILRIERKVIMPVGSSPLKKYTRFYSVRSEKASNYVIGVFVLDGHDAGVKIVAPEDMPLILDGGCSNIDLVYNLREDRVVSISCNGSG